MKLSSAKSCLRLNARHQLMRALHYFFLSSNDMTRASEWKLKRWALGCLVPHFNHSSPLNTYRFGKFRYTSRKKQQRLRRLYGSQLSFLLRDSLLLAPIAQEASSYVSLRKLIPDYPDLEAVI
jgi:hypothetical protein